MDLSFIMDYVVVVIVGICVCAGYVIKTSIPKISNSYIPLIMAVLGIVLNVWINMAVSPDILLAGMFSGLASTGLHQAFTQLINKDKQE